MASKKLDPAGLKALDSLASVECKLERQSINDSIDPKIIPLSAWVTETMREYAIQEIEKLNGKDGKEDDLLMWQGIKHRSDGIMNHLHLAYSYE